MDKIKKYSLTLKGKLNFLVIAAIVPLLLVTVYLVFALFAYRNAYDSIVSRMTIANNYNLNFKEEMDESIYKLAVGAVTFENISEDQTLRDPYVLMDELKKEFLYLNNNSEDQASRTYVQSLLRNLETLEDRIDDIKNNVEQGGSYEENMEMLDNDIYILTELIRDDIQYYIYYQTKAIENLKMQLNYQIATFIFIISVVIGIIVISFFVLASFLRRSIVKPLDELAAQTTKIAGGDFESRVNVETDDEIGKLAISVNDMSEHLEVLVDHIKEDERKMRHAELRLLQEQINPHFLYNTLDTIVWLIESNDSEKAVNMVISLSDFFRLVLSKGKEFISIKEEEQHIRSYLEIQQVRYHDILDYEINIDPSIYDYHILKLTLQPLVENSLYHGIKYKRAKGNINISGKLVGDNIELCVSDTGVGMDENVLNRLRDEIQKPCQETKNGFGLANVNERIRIYFGPEYGMHIDSEVGKGTVVKIIIPAKLKDAVAGEDK